jgi:hypothetical protein
MSCIVLKGCRWYPIVGGLGWGRIRISILWKPIDIDLPPRVSGYEVATLEITSIVATDLAKGYERGMSVVLETETDRFTLSSGDSNDIRNGRSSISASEPDTPTPKAFSFDDQAELEWEIDRPIRLAVEYRHSCSFLVSFVVKGGVLKKKRVLGLASLRLSECADEEEVTRSLPIFATASVQEATSASRIFELMQMGDNGEFASKPRSKPDEEVVARTKLVGFVSITVKLRPGVSRAHRKLAKRDLRFKHVYEAWEAEREFAVGLDKVEVGDIARRKRDEAIGLNRQGGEEGGEGEESGSESSGSESEEDEKPEAGGSGELGGKMRRIGSSGARSNRSGQSGRSPGKSGEEDEDGEWFESERKAHSHALHKRVRSIIFQASIQPHLPRPFSAKPLLSDSSSFSISWNRPST